MNLRYQRDLYRVQLCCDTDREETEQSYPLQMCLRNTIEGLLVCQTQKTDGHLAICWDVTSRHSLAQVTEDGQIPPSVLQRILQAILKTLDGMERFLIPCEYLVLDPELLFLAPETGEVRFICDFEDRQSFSKTLLTLGEYVLEHMDHRDERAMCLGYGLYRLAVEESFDKAGLQSLCTTVTEKKKVEPEKKQRSFEAYAAGENSPERYAGPENRERQDALEAFFSEDEKEETHQLSPWQICGGCAVTILCGTGIMEGVQYFRNGRHLQLIWLGVAAVLFLLSSVAMLLLWKLDRKRVGISEKKNRENNFPDVDEKKQDKRSRHRPVETDRDIQEWSRDNRNTAEQSQRGTGEYEQYLQTKSHTANRYDTGSYVKRERMMREPHLDLRCAPAGREAGSEQPESWETTVLNRSQPDRAKAELAFADGTRFPLAGQQWFIGKSPAQADLCLTQSTVSRLHARIWEKKGAYYIEDMHSRNGTIVEGSLLEPGERRKLASGMQLVFADVGCRFLTENDECEPEYSRKV